MSKVKKQYFEKSYKKLGSSSPETDPEVKSIIRQFRQGGLTGLTREEERLVSMAVNKNRED